MTRRARKPYPTVCWCGHYLFNHRKASPRGCLVKGCLCTNPSKRPADRRRPSPLTAKAWPQRMFIPESED